MNSDLDAVAANHGHHHRVGILDGHGLPRQRRLLVPGGLAPVHMDREHDRGSYWEPNVWMRDTL
jgi:hypothetical protein